MPQDPRKLRKLLEILTQFGVTSYKADDMQIEIVNPLTLANNLYGGAVSVANEEFSMDNYDKDAQIDDEQKKNGEDDSPNFLGYTEEQILNWSAG